MYCIRIEYLYYCCSCGTQNYLRYGRTASAPSLHKAADGTIDAENTTINSDAPLCCCCSYLLMQTLTSSLQYLGAPNACPSVRTVWLPAAAAASAASASRAAAAFDAVYSCTPSVCTYCGSIVWTSLSRIGADEGKGATERCVRNGQDEEGLSVRRGLPWTW